MTTPDEQAIRDLLTDMFDGWSPGAEPFGMDRVAGLYEQSKDFLAFDTLMPTTSVMDGWDSFLHHWEHAIGAMRGFRCELEDILRLEVQGDLAWTALMLSAEAELDNGDKLNAEQQVTLIWHRRPDGWRVVHEHLSGPVRPEAALD